MDKGNLKPWHLNWLTNLEVDRVDLVKEGANSQAFIMLAKQKGGKEMNVEEILKSMRPEHAAVIQKAMGDADKALVALQAELTEAKTQVVEKSKGEEDPEEILKSIQDPKLRTFMEQTISKAKAAEVAARMLVEEREQEEAAQVAKSVAGVGADVEELTELYKSLKQVAPEQCVKVFEIFKASANVAKDGQSIFQEAGTAVQKSAQFGGANKDAIWAQIEAQAVDVAKSRGISNAAAVTVVVKENPDLYKAYTRAV